MPRQRTIRPMLVIRRFWLTAAMLLFASGAGAQNTVERDVKAAPGKEARVAVCTDIKPDCTSGPLLLAALCVLTGRPHHPSVLFSLPGGDVLCTSGLAQVAAAAGLLTRDAYSVTGGE